MQKIKKRPEGRFETLNNLANLLGGAREVEEVADRAAVAELLFQASGAKLLNGSVTHTGIALILVDAAVPTGKGDLGSFVRAHIKGLRGLAVLASGVVCHVAIRGQ